MTSSRNHVDDMSARHLAGESMSQIARDYGVSRERVRQLLPSDVKEEARRRKDEERARREEAAREEAERRNAPPPHGTLRRYRRGCHCEECRAENRAHHYRWREDARARLERGEAEVEHGHPWTYSNWACRCPECTEAWRQYLKGIPVAERGGEDE